MQRQVMCRSEGSKYHNSGGKKGQYCVNIQALDSRPMAIHVVARVNQNVGSKEGGKSEL